MFDSTTRSVNYHQKWPLVITTVYSGYVILMKMVFPSSNRFTTKDKRLAPNEVVITGWRRGDRNRLSYGIESYFVPEGTGIEVERSAKYGIVKVNKNGDAMLVSLSP